ncbi:MAG: HEAT repeat domain-containing protein [Phycisphaerae bacterium]
MSTIINAIQGLEGLDRLVLLSLLVTLKVSLLLGVAWAALQCFRRSPATTRHAVWVVAFATALLLPVAESATPRWHLLPAISPAVSTANDLGQSESQHPALAPQVENTRTAVDSDPPRESLVHTEQASSPLRPATKVRASITPIPWSTIALVIWLVGVALLTVRLAFGSVCIMRLKRSARPASGADWDNAMKCALVNNAITRHVDLYLADNASVPMLVGLWKPAVILPKEAVHLSKAHKTAVLTHELAHVARADLHTTLLGNLVCILYWFNPLTWLAHRHMKFERERAADDTVISSGADPADYASQVLKVAASVAGHDKWTPIAAMARSSELEGRLLSILDRERSRRHISRSEMAAVALVSLVVLTPIAGISFSRPAMAKTKETQASTNVQESPRTTDWTVEEFLQGLRAEDRGLRELAERGLAMRDSEDPVVDGVVDQLAMELESENPRDRYAAVWQLEKTRSTRVFDLLTEQLEDSNALVRGGAAGALGELGNPEAVPFLAALADDDSGEVRTKAVRALGRFAGRDVVLALTTFADDSYSSTREWVARSLGSAGDPAGADTLLTLLEDPNSSVREWAIRSLNNIIDDRAIERLIDALQDNESNVREWATRTLMTYNDRRAVGPLTELLQDPETEVREWAARALASLGDPAAGEALDNATFDSDPEVREWAIRALRNVRDELAVDSLVDALRDDDAEVREQAVRTLMSYDDPRIADALIQSLADAEPEVREWSARALGQLRDPKTIDALVRSTSDTDEEVREWATRSLRKIDDEAALDALIDIVYNGLPDTQEWAVRGLGLRGGSRAVEVVKNILLDATATAEARAEAAQALGRMRESSAVDLLLRALDDDSEKVRLRAIGALGKFGGETVVERLTDVASDDPAPDVRRKAEDVLTRLRSKRES